MLSQIVQIKSGYHNSNTFNRRFPPGNGLKIIYDRYHYVNRKDGKFDNPGFKPWINDPG